MYIASLNDMYVKDNLYNTVLMSYCITLNFICCGAMNI